MHQHRFLRTFKAVCLLTLIAFGCEPPQRETDVLNTSLEAETAGGKFPYKKLSTYNFFKDKLNRLEPNPEIIPYQPASSLFTDYALKSRFIYFPDGEKAQLIANQFTFPIGTILIKNFYFPKDFRNTEGERKIIETRLLINGEKGWEAYPYIWNEDQTDAVLKVVGGEIEVAFVDQSGKEQIINYIIPNKNQCKTCHNKSEVLAPIGIEVQHLNNQYQFADTLSNQLALWQKLGKLDGFQGADAHPAMINYEDKNLPLDQRAMAYLDINCAHCHSPEGPASTSGLFLTYDQTDPMKLGIFKTPVAAGNGAGTFKFDIYPGKADQSILTHRMNSTEVGVAMPELGRTTIHQEGVELIREWINSMESNK